MPPSYMNIVLALIDICELTYYRAAAKAFEPIRLRQRGKLQATGDVVRRSRIAIGEGREIR